MKKRNLGILLATGICCGIFILIALTNNSDQKFNPRSNNNRSESYSAAGAAEWLKMRRVNPVTGIVNPNDVQAAMMQVDALRKLKGTQSLNLSWADMGPDNVGGRTRAILIDKDNHNQMYAGGVSGGLWMTLSGGTSWKKVSAFNDAGFGIAVTSICQAANGDIYVGTGEGLAQPFGIPYNTGTYGQGIWKYTNSADTWTHLSSTWSNDSSNTLLNSTFCFVNRLAAHPTDANKIYAAVAGGLMMTSDGGATWVDPLPYGGGEGKDVKVGSDGTVITCVGSAAYVTHSGDNDVFEKKSGNTAGMIASSGRMEFAISLSNPAFIYCSATKGDGSLDKVYCSSDNGNTWSSIAIGSHLFVPFGDNKQGWYDNTIAVFPDNPNKVLLGGVDIYKWELGGNFEKITQWNLGSYNPCFVHADIHAIIFHPDYNGTTNKTLFVGCDGGIFRSIDGSVSFTAINKSYNVTQCYSVAYSGDGKVMCGTQDNGTNYIDFSGNTYQGSVQVDGGDGGYCDISMIYPKAMFTSVYYSNVSRSEDYGATSTSLYNGVEKQDPFVTPIRLWESFYDTLSTDSVMVIAAKNYFNGDVITGKSKTGNINIYHKFQFANPADTFHKGDTMYIKDYLQSVLAIGLAGKIGITRKALNFAEEGVNTAAANIPDNCVVQTMEFSKDGNYLFIATSNGYSGSRLYRISNILQARASVQLQNLTADSLKIFSQTICGIAVDPTNPNNVLLAMGNYGESTYVLYSQNATSAHPVFNTRQGNLPKAPVYCGIIDYRDWKKAIIGTEFGVYSCADITSANPVWTDENDATLDRVPVFMMRQQTFPNGWNRDARMQTIVSNQGVIYIGTHGRGIFRTETLKNPFVNVPDINDLAHLAPSVSVYPNPVSDIANISYSISSKSDVTIYIYDTHGRLVNTSISRNMQAGQYNYSFNVAGLKAGTYFVGILSGNEKATSKFIVN